MKGSSSPPPPPPLSALSPTQSTQSSPPPQQPRQPQQPQQQPPTNLILPPLSSALAGAAGEATPDMVRVYARSHCPAARRVSSADSTSRRSPPAADSTSCASGRSNRPSSYHYDSRRPELNKFYNIHDPPPLEIISQCISGFIRGTSTLIYILAEYEVFELINATYYPISSQTKITPSQFCELLSIAAIGSQYEDISQEVQLALFKSAKWCLDSGAGKEWDPLRRMRTSMLVGLFFVFEKSFWARDYLDQAIELARARGLNLMQRHPDYSEREWASWKRVWGSLVFLDGWLSGSLGNIPTICDGEDPIYGEGYRTCTNDLDAYLHAEVIKLSILMGSITKDVYTPTFIEFNKVAVYSARLKTWHSSLPESLRLHRAVSGNDSKQRSTILLAHSSYLSCIILLTRRILLERLEGRFEGLDGLARMAVADEYARMCVSAGRQLATVVGLLHSEGRIVRRCWMLIQAAYTAGLIVLLCLSSGESDGSSHAGKQTEVQDQDLLNKCIGALEVCAVYDLVAQRFLDILVALRRLVVVPDDTAGSSPQSAGSKRRFDQDNSTFSERSHFLPSFSPTNELTRHILDRFRVPFGGESKVIGRDEYTLSKFFPQNWRFLVPEPPPMGTFNLDGSTSSSPPGDGSDSNERRDSKKPRGPPHFKTKEEYEAFFRRIS